MLNLDQHMDIHLLHRQGHSIRAIARLSGHSRNTVRKVLKAKSAPVFRAPKRASKLDEHKDYLRERVSACNLSGHRLYQEIQQMGYEGGYTIVKDFLRTIRPRPSGKLTVRFETPACSATSAWVKERSSRRRAMRLPISPRIASSEMSFDIFITVTIDE